METWILAGQSNMEGRGLLDDPRARLEPVDRVLALSSAGEWETAADPLHRPWESFTPIHRELAREKLERNEPQLRHLSDAELATRERRDGNTGAGLGVAFGQALAEAKGTQVGLIPAAHGGTSLDEWRVGSLPDGGRTLAGSLWERVQRARATASVELGGILWYQGEADDSVEDAQSYGRRFDDWVNSIRAQLDAPRLPVYVVQLGRVVATELDLLADGWVEAGLDAVREAQRAAPGRLADVGMVSAIDLGLVDDCHIDAPGLVRLGRRLARLVLNDGRAPNVVRVERAPDSGRDLHQVRVVCDGVAGGWSPASHITGFDIRDTSGEKHRAVDVVEAHPDPRDPCTINLILTSHGDFDWGIRVAYGLGFNAPCNAVDAEDMALPAFAAQPVRL